MSKQTVLSFIVKLIDSIEIYENDNSFRAVKEIRLKNKIRKCENFKKIFLYYKNNKKDIFNKKYKKKNYNSNLKFKSELGNKIKTKKRGGESWGGATTN